ncbi:MAG: SUKH-3 domain-containing protein [Crinalium sp.]
MNQPIFDKFSKEAKQIFLSNNIDGSKEIDCQQLEQLLNEAGYTISDIVKCFFSMCAYCRIEFPYDISNPTNNIYWELIVDPTGDIDTEDKIELKRLFNLDLCPLAYTNWNASIFIDENEYVYIFEDCTLYLLGNSLVSGIEEIFKGKNWLINPRNEVKPLEKP